MITIQLNNRSLNINKNLNVLNLLHKINSPTQGIAVAINTEIISQSNWEKTLVNHLDDVLIIQATQGG